MLVALFIKKTLVALFIGAEQTAFASKLFNPFSNRSLTEEDFHTFVPVFCVYIPRLSSLVNELYINLIYIYYPCPQNTFRNVYRIRSQMSFVDHCTFIILWCNLILFHG